MYQQMKRITSVFACSAAATVVLFCLNVFFGSVDIPAAGVCDVLLGRSSNEAWRFIVLESRLVQAVTAMLGGAALSAAGQITDTPAQETAEPAPTATPSTEEALAEIKDINRQLPTEQQLTAIRRVDSYFWDEYLPTLWGYKFNGGMTSLVEDPAAESAENENLAAILQEPRADGTTWQDFLNAGKGTFAKVNFEAELEPEKLFLGPQYGEGNFYIYIAVPYDKSEPCEPVSGWQQNNNGEVAHFGTIDPARELRLTNRQYRTLVHQCNALAQALFSLYSSMI